MRKTTTVTLAAHARRGLTSVCSFHGTEEVTKTCYCLIIATNDVQSAAASTNGTNNMILITAKFIEHTTAKGCFVVLQCQYGSPDVFRALLLPNNFSGSVENTIDGVPASTYSMLVYDLEEDGLPNTKPAVEQSRTVTVEGEGKYVLFWHLASFCYVHFQMQSLIQNQIS